MTARYQARFRFEGPTYTVGTFDTAAEKNAAIAGAKQLFTSGKAIPVARQLPVAKVDHRTMAERLLEGVERGRFDDNLDGLIKAVEDRKAMLAQLPVQTGFGLATGRNDLEVRREVYGTPLSAEKAQALFPPGRRGKSTYRGNHG